jgi:hypothetical protein
MKWIFSASSGKLSGFAATAVEGKRTTGFGYFFIQCVYITQQGADIMQKRFCSCGGSVWVRYIFANRRWLAFFFSARNESTDCCPHCGRLLDIQQLL